MSVNFNLAKLALNPGELENVITKYSSYEEGNARHIEANGVVSAAKFPKQNRDRFYAAVALTALATLAAAFSAYAFLSVAFSFVAVVGIAGAAKFGHELHGDIVFLKQQMDAFEAAEVNE